MCSSILQGKPNSNMFLFAIAIFFVCFVFILSHIFTVQSSQPKDYSKPISLPPSPPRLPTIGHLHLLSKLPHQSLHKLSEKYGPIMKIDVGFVPKIVVSSPELAELFLKTHDLKFSNRPKTEVSESTSLGSKGMLFSEYGTYLRDLRKLCKAHLLSASKIEYFRPIRKEEVTELIRRMKEATLGGKVVNISSEIFLAIEKITCRTVFGTANEEKLRLEFKPLVEEGLRLIGAFSLNDTFPFMKAFNFQGLTRRSKNIMKIMDAMLDKIIDEYEQLLINQEEPQMSVMTSLMKYYNDNDNKVNRTSIKVVILDLLGGTWMTSATTIEWALKELMHYPEVMKRVQEELENVVGMDRMVEESDCAKLTYLNMVVKEAMRLHPFVSLIPRESVEDVWANGFFIPKKSHVLVNVWAIGRDHNSWSDNVDKFYPERFANTDIDVRGQHFQLIPFGSGHRACPGLELGLRKVQIILAQLLHCFNLNFPDGMIPEDLDMSENFGGKTTPIIVLPTYRLQA